MLVFRIRTVAVLVPYAKLHRWIDELLMIAVEVPLGNVKLVVRYSA